MRASSQEQTGSAGENEAAANFERLGWGPVPNPTHDLGTDLFLQVRDERRFDLGLLVGAQVKSGPKAFKAPKLHAGGEPEGWWFRDDDRRHVDAWLRHTAPHLIVLHNLDTRVSYWAHVTEESVVSTGIGAKVFVPVGNVVDVGQREALLEVAGARRPGVAWEGSVWMAGASILARDRLRHALIVPRLVAPHPNAGPAEPLSADQAIAMLMQARLRELDAFAERHADVPQITDASESTDWSWRFAGALYARAVDSGLEALLEVVADAPTFEARTAATVTAACGLIEDGRAPEALTVLDAALEHDDAATVDHAWLQVQRARARAEIGRLAEAQDDALGAQGVRLKVANDATATAIAASAAILLFNTSSWGQRDLRETITYADTAANWWRTQVTATGLWAITDRSFASWTRSRSTTFASGDPAHNDLAAAALMASHAGDQSGWQYHSAGTAKSDLLQIDRHADPDTVAAALTTLRRAGDHKALEQAVRRIVADGPAAAATAAAALVDLNASSRTTGLSDLTLLEHAGDALDAETAERTVVWLLRTLEDPLPFATRTTPSYLLLDQLVETLASVVGATDDAVVRRVIDHLLAMDGVEHQIDAQAWARVVRALPRTAWTDEDIVRARNVANRHDGVLRLALLAHASEAGDTAARATLLAEAGDGSIDALTALGNVRELPTPLVASQIKARAAQATSLIANARAGSHGIGGDDVGYNIVLLNVWHPSLAIWDPLLELLAADAVIADHKRRSLRLLTNVADRLPAEIRRRLEPIALALARPDSSIASGLFNDERSVRDEAALLAATIAAMDPTETTKLLVRLLGGDNVDRVRALVLIDRVSVPEQLGMTVALTGDPDPDVRATAAALLAARIDQTESGVALDAIRAATRDPGTRVPTAIVAALKGATTPAAQEVRNSLRYHRSARVRRAARAT